METQVNGTLTPDAYDIAANADFERESIIADIKDAIEEQQTNPGDVTQIKVEIDGKDIPIDTGAGALVLDAKLQELSVQGQVAAQFVAGQKRAWTEIKSAIR